MPELYFVPTERCGDLPLAVDRYPNLSCERQTLYCYDSSQCTLKSDFPIVITCFSLKFTSNPSLQSDHLGEFSLAIFLGTVDLKILHYFIISKRYC